MLDLAQHDGDQPRMIGDICKAQDLSKKYVGRLILKLRNAGMIASVRGAKGGYKINCIARDIWGELNEKIRKTLESLTLQDIINRHADIEDYCI